MDLLHVESNDGWKVTFTSFPMLISPLINAWNPLSSNRSIGQSEQDRIDQELKDKNEKRDHKQAITTNVTQKALNFRRMSTWHGETMRSLFAVSKTIIDVSLRRLPNREKEWCCLFNFSSPDRSMMSWAHARCVIWAGDNSYSDQLSLSLAPFNVEIK